MARQKVLITGMSGLIGQSVRRRLEGDYALCALNRREVPGVVCHRADIADLEAILPAFEGQDAVVHLAAIARGDAPWEEVLHHNIIGTYNVFEAARRAGVGRVVYASSGATVAGWEREMPYRALVAGEYEEVPVPWEKLTHESGIRPKGLYGCSKVWGEALGRHFSDEYGMSVLCLRIGAVLKADRPAQARHYSVWCSQRDIAQMVARCLEAPADLLFDVFYVTSDNQWGYRDLAHAREVLAFLPKDQAEAFRGGGRGGKA